jgi:hypothetical protein
MRSTNSTALYRPDLGIAVMEYVEGPTMGLIGLELMPIFPVDFPAFTFPVIPKEVLLKLPDTSRSPRGNYNRGDWKYEEGRYNTGHEHGWEEPIDDSERAMIETRTPGMADFVATRRAMNFVLKGQEYRISNKLFNASNFTAHAITNEWDDFANATPISDVKAAKIAFRLQCGMLPDALVINWTVLQNLKSCTQIVDRLKYTYPGIDIEAMGASELARILDVPRVIVGGAIYDSAGKNVTSVLTDVWSDEYAALVKIVPNSQDITAPGLGWTFLWTADSPDNAIVETYREDQIRSDIIRVRHNTDECLLKSYDENGNVVSDIAAACMYLMSNITTHP